MENNEIYSRNLKALSLTHGELCSRLSQIKPAAKRYSFRESRSGEKIPAWMDSSGNAHPLHSTVDPKKEAQRLIGKPAGGFLIILGLGGPFYAEAALESEAGMLLVLENGIEGVNELFYNLDYSRVLGDSRFRLVIDAGAIELLHIITSLYQPVIYGGIKVVPLRSRITHENEPFALMAKTIEEALKQVSSDYSVQTHFGRCWFSNIIRNMALMREDDFDELYDGIPSIQRAAVCAAGPSLSLQIPVIRERRDEFFLIATDTSLPCLLGGKIIPDAVISMDCQHIGYHHFMESIPEGVILFLDLASPPILAARSGKIIFYSSGHPLAMYISKAWKPLPELDTSGGNVTYAAVSLAEKLGARKIELFGADYSYPGGVPYAKGAYIYPLFEARQNRFRPLEAQSSAFIFRTPLEKKAGTPWYYKTSLMDFYREKLEEKGRVMEAAILPAAGLGVQLDIKQPEKKNVSDSGGINSVFKNVFFGENGSGKDNHRSSREFLEDYKREVEGNSLKVFPGLLPLAAFLKHSLCIDNFGDLIEETKTFCINKINKILGQ